MTGSKIFGNQEDLSEDEYSDPALTLNLLRQKNDAEIRCGSAELNDRRTFYFTGSKLTENTRNA